MPTIVESDPIYRSIICDDLDVLKRFYKTCELVWASKDPSGPEDFKGVNHDQYIFTERGVWHFNWSTQELKRLRARNGEWLDGLSHAELIELKESRFATQEELAWLSVEAYPHKLYKHRQEHFFSLKTAQGGNLVSLAAAHGAIKVLSWLLEFCKMQPLLDSDGISPIMHAAQKGQLHVVQYLYPLTYAYVHLTAKSKEGYTILAHAAANGQLDVVKFLMQQWLSPTFNPTYNLMVRQVITDALSLAVGPHPKTAKFLYYELKRQQPDFNQGVDPDKGLIDEEKAEQEIQAYSSKDSLSPSEEEKLRQLKTGLLLKRLSVFDQEKSEQVQAYSMLLHAVEKHSAPKIEVDRTELYLNVQEKSQIERYINQQRLFEDLIKSGFTVNDRPPNPLEHGLIPSEMDILQLQCAIQTAQIAALMHENNSLKKTVVATTSLAAESAEVAPKSLQVTQDGNVSTGIATLTIFKKATNEESNPKRMQAHGQMW